MYSNLIQLTSGILHEKIKVSAGVLGLYNDRFSSVSGKFFCWKFNFNWVISFQDVDPKARVTAYYRSSFC